MWTLSLILFMLRGMPGQQPERRLKLVQPDVTMESLAAADPTRAAELQAVFDKTPIEQVSANTGLGFHELSQVISYTVNGTIRSGTLASVITDPECPVGGMVSKRFANSGIEGVERLITGWAEDDPDMNVTFSESTLRGEPNLEPDKQEVTQTVPEIPDPVAEPPPVKKKWLAVQ